MSHKKLIISSKWEKIEITKAFEEGKFKDL